MAVRPGPHDGLAEHDGDLLHLYHERQQLGRVRQRPDRHELRAVQGRGADRDVRPVPEQLEDLDLLRQDGPVLRDAAEQRLRRDTGDQLPAADGKRELDQVLQLLQLQGLCDDPEQGGDQLQGARHVHVEAEGGEPRWRHPGQQLVGHLQPAGGEPPQRAVDGRQGECPRGEGDADGTYA